MVYMGRVFLTGLALAVVACGSSPKTQEPPLPVTYIASVVPYENANVGNDAVQSECDWTHTMPQQIAEESDGTVIVDDGEFAKPDVRKLSLVIVNVHALGGGGYTGPKWATIQGRLSDNGKIIGTFELGRETITGSFRACKTLRNLGEELSGDVAEWLHHPTINPEVKG